MGIEKAKEHEDRDKRRAKKKASAPWAAEENQVDTVTWEEVDPLLVAYVVQATCGYGASAQFTRSRDGGALGVRVYDENLVTKTEWGRPDEEFETLLYTIGDYYRLEAGKEVVRWQ